METSTTPTRRMLRCLALGFLIAAAVVPTAQAATIPASLSDRQFAPTSSPGVVIPGDLSGRQFAPTAAVPTDGTGAGVPVPLDGRQFGPSTLPLVAIPESLSDREFGPTPGDGIAVVPVASPTDGFNWGDAGVGAASAVALALLVVGALKLGRRQTQPVRAA